MISTFMKESALLVKLDILLRTVDIVLFAETAKLSQTQRNVTMAIPMMGTGAAQNVLLNKGGSAPLILPQDLPNAHQYVVTELSQFKRNVMIKTVLMAMDVAQRALLK